MQSAVDEQSTHPSLILAAIEGSSSAWHQLAFIYGPLVRKWALRMGIQQESDAQDVVQEVFAGLLERFSDFELERGFRSWLYGITRFKVLQQKRARYQQSLGGKVSLDQMMANGSDLTVASSDDEEWEIDEANQQHSDRLYLISRSLEVLSATMAPTTLEMFRATVLESNTTAEIAVKFSVSKATVRQNRSRVMRKLKAMLGEDLPTWFVD